MTDALNPTVPAGWYPDPWGATAQRWWDGYSWTDNLHPAPEPDAPTHEPAHAHAHAADTHVAEPAHVGGIATATHTATAHATSAHAATQTTATPATTVGPASHFEPHRSRHAEGAPAPATLDAPTAVSPAYQNAPAPAALPGSPYPSRRALRQLAATTGTIPIVSSDEFVHPEPAPAVPAGVFSAVTAEPLPPFIQTPEFTPEPVSALPPPVWTEPEPVAVAPEPVPPEPVAVEPVAVAPEPTADVPMPAPTGEPIGALADPVLATPIAAGQVAEPVVQTSVAEPVVSAPPPLVSSAPVPVTADDDGWAASLSLSKWDESEDSGEPTVPAETRPIFGDTPPVSYSQRAMKYQPLHGRTSPVWLIVLMPLLQAAAAIGSLFLLPGVLTPSAQFAALVPTTENLAALGNWVLFVAAPIAIVFFLFTLIMGFQDRARLRLLGHDQTASPWWILLHPLAYLIVRSIRVRQSTGRKGSAPLTIYLCLYVAPPIALGIATAVISALDGAIPA